MPDGFIVTLIKSLILANLVMGVFAMLTWAERRLLGRFQVRLGPNRVGPFGLLQPIADLVKLIRKESLMPVGVNPVLYLAAPVVSLFASLAVFAVIPFGGRADDPGHVVSLPPVGVGSRASPCWSCSRSARSASTASWSAAGRRARSTRLYGSMRAVSQLISYEVSLALAVIGVVMMSHTLSLTGIVAAQHHDGLWYIFPQFLGFAVYVVASTAEVEPDPVRPARGRGRAGGRLPHRVRRHALCDVPERRVRRPDRVLGHRLDPVPGRLRRPVPARPGVDAARRCPCSSSAAMWVRATLPRVRYDALMSIGWKVLLPLATLNLLVTSVIVAWRA